MNGKRRMNKPRKYQVGGRIQAVLAIFSLVVVVMPVRASILPEEPLHKAVMAGNLEQVGVLIVRGVDLEKIDGNFGCTAMYLAAREGHLEIVRALRDAGAGMDPGTDGGEPLAFAAVYSGNVDLMGYLLENGVDKAVRNADEQTLLHHAIAFRREEMVLYLVDIGVDVNAVDKRGWAPLHMAAWVGDLPVTGQLMGAGGDAAAKLASGETPLHLAVVYNHGEVVEDLLAAGIDVDQLDESGRSALFSVQSIEVMDLLLNAGADPDISDKAGYTPLSAAVVGDDAVVRVGRLIEAGADVNKRIDHGRTAIFNVIPEDVVEVFALLVEKGARLDIVSDSGDTPLEWLENYKAAKIREWLVEDREE